MKKLIPVGLALVFGLLTFTGCDFLPVGTDSETERPSVSEILPEESPETPDEGENSKEEQQTPAVSPLALLETVDISKAFGDREAEDWSFVFEAAGEMNASYGFRLTSEISDEDKLNFECGLGIGLDDIFGIRSKEENTLGVELFGGGKVSLLLNYRGPSKDSEPLQKNFNVGFRHDGDIVWYAGEGESETRISLDEVKEKIETAAMVAASDRMEEAFSVIPEELEKGVSLRFAVEKLMDLGFTVSIDDSDGIAIMLTANEGFYTDLLNDMLEKLIPAKWLNYLPRTDFGYERTVFDIRLAFGENGLFREYSMRSDVALTASLEVRKLFSSESTMKVGGGFSFTAQCGELSNATVKQ